uniref:Uncharacterized protein n=1 Tax=Arundo donax TaxID=35708 RepID=A0A0A9FU87_ARUDO
MSKYRRLKLIFAYMVNYSVDKNNHMVNAPYNHPILN